MTCVDGSTETRKTSRQTLRQTDSQTDRQIAPCVLSICLLSQIIEQSQCMTRCRPFVEILSIYSTNSRVVYGLPLYTFSLQPTNIVPLLFSIYPLSPHCLSILSYPLPFPSLRPSVSPSISPSLSRSKPEIEERKREQFLVSKQTTLNRGERRTMPCV